MKFIEQLRKFIQQKSNLTWLAFAILALIITWATVDQIGQNAKLERQTRQLKEEIDLLEQKIAVEELEQEFLITDDYLKLLAAEQLSLVEPGASLLILDHSKDIAPLAEQYQQMPEPQIKVAQPTTLEQWIRFFSGEEPL